MTILQLNPQIPLHTVKGDGYAIAILDYSQDHHILWLVAMNKTGEIWAIPNSEVRMQWNYSLERRKHEEVKCSEKV